MLRSILSSLAAASLVLAQSGQLQVPVPWEVTNLQLYNIRHGTGGTWNFNILDPSTLAPQSFNTTCHFYGPSSYYFAMDDYPVDQPCANPNITFSFYPDGTLFHLNVTHLWADGDGAHNDTGTFAFSTDDVRGQQMDVENNFGQYGGFSRSFFRVYPERAVPASRCEFC
jgi:hypothetical protein